MKHFTLWITTESNSHMRLQPDVSHINSHTQGGSRAFEEVNGSLRSVQGPWRRLKEFLRSSKDS